MPIRGGRKQKRVSFSETKMDQKKYQKKNHHGFMILNNKHESNSDLTINIVEKLQDFMTRLIDDYVSSDGILINYEKLKTSSFWTVEYMFIVTLFNCVDFSELTVNQRKAFFINVYNMLTIHRICETQDTLPLSVNEISEFRYSSYFIGGHAYSLADIVNGILRGNKPRPTSAVNQLDEEDTRLKNVLTTDPRVLFALTTGSKASPALKVYTVVNLHSQLEDSLIKYLDRTTKFIFESNIKEVIISQLFQWYRQDFGGDDQSCLRWIKKYLDEDRQGKLNTCLHELDQGTCCVSFDEFDWKLNRKLISVSSSTESE